MQWVSSRIWTRVAVFISYDDNNYTTVTSQLFVYAQLNDQTVLFQTIRLSISHFFAHSLNVNQFYLTPR